MIAKPVSRREQAARDIDEAADYYFDEGGAALEIRFVDALDVALAQLARHPGTGSLRYADRAQRAQMRFWPLKRFPYLIFYVELADRIDVLRVLHGSRDIPATLREENGDAGPEA